MLFTLALPLVILHVLGGVFGSTPNPDLRGVRPINYYLPAYVGLLIASIGLIGLPVQWRRTGSEVSCAGSAPPRCRQSASSAPRS